MDTSAIISLNQSYDRLCHWECQLLFNESPDENTEPNIVDLLSFHEAWENDPSFRSSLDKSYPSFCVYRFPQRYSGSYDATYKLLLEDIKRSAISCGYKLFQSKARKIMQGQSVTMGCCQHRKYYPPDDRYVKDFKPGSLFADGLRRKTIRRNDMFESRGQVGKSMPRKTTTSKPTDLSEICPFHINVFWSIHDSQWYLTKTASDRCHEHHPILDAELIKINRKQMSDSTKLLTTDCLEVHTKPSQVSKIIHQRTGQLFSSRQVKLFRKKRKPYPLLPKISQKTKTPLRSSWWIPSKPQNQLVFLHCSTTLNQHSSQTNHVAKRTPIPPDGRRRKNVPPISG